MKQAWLRPSSEIVERSVVFVVAHLHNHTRTLSYTRTNLKMWAKTCCWCCDTASRLLFTSLGQYKTVGKITSRTGLFVLLSRLSVSRWFFATHLFFLFHILFLSFPSLSMTRFTYIRGSSKKKVKEPRQ